MCDEWMGGGGRGKAKLSRDKAGKGFLSEMNHEMVPGRYSEKAYNKGTYYMQGIDVAN